MSGLKVVVVGLTELQERFVSSYLDTGDVSASARIAGYTNPQSGYAALKSSAVQAAIQDNLGRLIKTAGAQKAHATMMALMDASQPATVRFAAAKWMYEASGAGAKAAAAQAADKPLLEMTDIELAAFLARAEGIIEAGGSAPIITVTPNNGALPLALAHPSDCDDAFCDVPHTV